MGDQGGTSCGEAEETVKTVHGYGVVRRRFLGQEVSSDSGARQQSFVVVDL